MKVTQEKLPASQIGLEIEVPADISQKTYDKVFQDLARTASIPGFRKGKAPRKILLQRLGTVRIKAAAVEELIQNSLKKAVEQETLDVIGSFELRSSFDELVEKFEPGEPLTFSAAVDVPPEVTLADYSQLSIKVEEVVYDPAEVDKFLEERRRENATLIPVEGRPAQYADVAVVDYQAKLVGETDEETTEIPGGQATDFQVELVEERFLEEFVAGIQGMNIGETKEITVNFPEDYAREDLAGESAIFTITLKDLKEKELPEVNDDFAQEVSEFETLEELRASLETRFKEKAEQETTSNKENAIVQELVKLITVDLPETMIEKEVETLLTRTFMQLESYGMDVRKILNAETIPAFRERSRPEAIARIQQSLALEEVAKKESVEVDPAALEVRIKELQEQLKGQNIDQKRLRNLVTNDLRKEATVKWLIERAQIELVPLGSLTPAESEESNPEESAEATIEAEVTTTSEA